MRFKSLCPHCNEKILVSFKRRIEKIVEHNKKGVIINPDILLELDILKRTKKKKEGGK